MSTPRASWTPHSPPSSASPSPALADIIPPSQQGAPDAEHQEAGSPVVVEPEPSPRGALRLVGGDAGEHTGEVLRRRYELLQELGRGGMAVVYEARFLPSDARRVAVKILSPRLSRKPESARRFAREFKILDALEHPNLVTVRDFDRAEDGRLFMVMERINGRSLDKIKGPLPPAQVIQIGEQLCDVLAALHATGVIHRDLKPSNVILLNGEGLRIKLVDLGIARLEAAWYLEDRPYLTPPAERGLTRTGLVLGTPRYVPPEAGTSAPTILWDIYALGVLLWQLATGSPPPAAWREEGVLDEVPEGRFGLPRVLERALRSAMHYSPNKRFLSALEFQEELSVAAAELDTEGEDVAAADDKTEARRDAATTQTSLSSRASHTSAPETPRASSWLIPAILLSALVGATTAAVLLQLATPMTGGNSNAEVLPSPRSPANAPPQKAPPFTPPPLPEDVAVQLSACVSSDVPGDTLLELRLDAAGQTANVDAGDELDALALRCIHRTLADVPLSRSGVAETHRVPLSELLNTGGAHAP